MSVSVILCMFAGRWRRQPTENNYTDMEMNQITVSDADLRKGVEEGMDAFLKLINFLPLILIVFGMIAFTVAGFLFNTILGVVLIGVTLIITGLLMIPIKLGGGE